MPPLVADRLRDGRAIGAVLRGRRKRAGHRLVVHALERGDAQPARLAVVASRRVGGAVQRNRAKRLLREAIRTRSWNPGIDVVVVAREPCAHSVLSEVARELEAATRTLGIADHHRVGTAS